MDNIATTNGRPAMAYTGETPWHRKGTRVDQVMTSKVAIERAGLDYIVEKRPVHFPDVSRYMTQFPGKFVTVRKDTDAPLGIVGDVYRVLQNKEAFSFFDSIVGEKLAMYHTAGALGEGEKIWLLAKLPRDFWVTPEDAVEQYLLLTNSHDGSSAVQIMATPIRVVCQNTLNMAISSSTRKTKVRHTMSMGQGIRQIREQIGIADKFFKEFEEMGKFLVAKQANAKIVEQLLSDLGLSKEKGEDSTRTENIRFDILKLFERGKGNQLPGVKGSAWALLNGVVEYVDYHRTARGEGVEKDQNRTNSLLFGSGALMKQKALDSLITAYR